MDVSFLRFLPEFHETVQRAVVRDRQVTHPELLGAIKEVGNFSQPVEERVVRVDVEMREFRHGVSSTVPHVSMKDEGDEC